MAEKLWIQQYMREPESGRRREILEQAIAEEGLTPDNELRQKLLNARYQEKDGREIDTFIRGWVNLSFLDNSSTGFFSKKRIEKEKKSVLSDWQLELAESYGETGRQVLYEEMFNLARLYMQICEEDKTYGSVILGLGQMKKERRTAKIARDVYRAAYELPARYDLREKLAVFTQAATDAFYEVYDRDKDLLRQLIGGLKKEG